MAVINIPSTESSQVVDLTPDPRWQIAERAVRSSALKRAAQLQAILLYVVRHAILEPEQPLREYEIACAVLGRRSDFTPVDDNIVRVQIGHLRKKLEQYFATEGLHESLVITLERGSYTPVFRTREAARLEVHEPFGAAIPLAARESTEAIPLLLPPPVSAPANGRWLTTMLIVAVVAAFAGWMAGRFSRPADQPERLSAANISNPILRRVFAPNAVVNVVVADTSLVFLQNTIRSNISIAQYLDRSYPANILGQVTDPSSRRIFSDLALGHQYTSFDAADVVGLCFKWGYILGAKPIDKYPRELHVRDFEQGNFVIIGSRRGNPWVSNFDDDVNFVFEEVLPSHTFHFRNRQPSPGEPATYEFVDQSDGQSIGYVDIVVLPNSTRSGSVLLINGFSRETNEAAANLIFSKDLPPALSRAISAGKPYGKIEILMRVHNLDGSQNGSEIVATRIE